MRNVAFVFMAGAGSKGVGPHARDEGVHRLGKKERLSERFFTLGFPFSLTFNQTGERSRSLPGFLFSRSHERIAPQNVSHSVPLSRQSPGTIDRRKPFHLTLLVHNFGILHSSAENVAIEPKIK
jgi:hypothetical protein